MEVIGRGLPQEAKMSTLPHPETLVPCPALPPSPSFVPVALPFCELSSQGRTGEASPVISNMSKACCRHPPPALRRA